MTASYYMQNAALELFYFVRCLSNICWMERKMMTRADLHQYCFLCSQIFEGTFFSLLWTAISTLSI